MFREKPYIGSSSSSFFGTKLLYLCISTYKHCWPCFEYNSRQVVRKFVKYEFFIWSEWRLTVITATVRIALVDILDLSEVDIPAGVFLHPAVGWG